MSVIIPSRNRVALLRRALRSVQAQTRRADEIVVVDDGSTDGTRETIAREFPEVRYFRQPPRGVSAARNRSIRTARGDWLAFLDSDDEWAPDKLEKQRAALDENPDMRVCHTEEIWIRRGVRVNPRKRHAKAGGWIFQCCLPLCAMSPSSIVIHRSVFAAVGVFDQSFPVCEDYDLWLRITSRYPVLFLDRPLTIKYGGHHDQLSKSCEALDRYRIQALEEILAAGHLNAADARAARAMLVNKASIYLKGARRRGKQAEVRRLEALCRRYARDEHGAHSI